MAYLSKDVDENKKRYYSIFKGGWIDSDYVLAECPLCGEKYSFSFAGLTGVWRCASCNKGGNFAHLKELLAEDVLWSDKFSELAQPSAPEGLIQIGKYIPPKEGIRFSTGFSAIDQKLGGLNTSEVSVLTGKTGEGKSTFAGQLALNLMQSGAKICFYSGELSAATFQAWILKQSAGERYLDHYVDEFGADRYHVEPYAEGRIKSWLTDRFILYDNSVHRSSERNEMLDRFLMAKRYYGCNFFFIDNLMTAKYTKDNERDYNRQQGNFVGELMDFAMQEQSHVILIAHPRKMDTGDINDDIAGTKEIANRVNNIFQIHRLSEEEAKKAPEPMESLFTISKHRDDGEHTKIGLRFDKPSKRFRPTAGDCIRSYDWEREM